MKKVKFWLWFGPCLPVIVVLVLIGAAVGYACGYAVWAWSVFHNAFAHGYDEGCTPMEYPHETSPRRSGGLF